MSEIIREKGLHKRTEPIISALPTSTDTRTATKKKTEREKRKTVVTVHNTKNNGNC